MADNINRPEHYTYGRFECIDVIADVTTGLSGVKAFCLGNVLKYIWRYRFKNGSEDLQKARFYLDRLIAEYTEDDREV